MPKDAFSEMSGETSPTENPSLQTEMSGSLEQDIRRLEQRLKTLREQKEKIAPREVLKHYLAEKTGGAPGQLVVTPPPSPTPPESAEYLPGYLKEYDDEVKSTVRQLIQTAWQKGIEAAAADARKHGPFVMDAFHDALVDKLYDQLKKRGIL